MTLSETPGSLKRFRRTPWGSQQTFSTPLKNLQPFVATITSAFDTASITIDQVIFAPKHLLDLLARCSLPARYGRDLTFVATGNEEVQALLQAALSDWIDFIFVPAPKPFVIYADHDEYTTFYANTKSNLNRVVDALSQQGFEKVKDYERNL
jgi:hypothetical protein